MDFAQVVARRRMCRDFLDRAVEPEIVDRVLDRARRAPSAGHTQGWSFVVLEGDAQTATFWVHDAQAAWLARPNHPGVLRAPVIIVPLASRQAYVERYAEADKQTPTGCGPQSWEVPYWLVDCSFSTMVLLLAAGDEGLGALFFALHGQPETLLRALGIPGGWQPLGAVALGWPVPGHRASASAGRGLRPLDEVVHRGGW